MNKEELKKEAEEKYHNHKVEDFQGFYNHHYYYLGYVESAEPREKQIEIDAEQIRALQKQNGELTDKVKELEAQIEKMKCCGNCKWSDSEGKLVHPPCKECNWDLDKWEIKEK